MQWSCDEWETTSAENSQKHLKGKKDMAGEIPFKRLISELKGDYQIN